MTPAEIALLISLLTLLVNTTVALVIHSHTRHLAKVQLSQQVQEQWREIDKATGNDEVAVSIVRAFSSEKPEEIQLNDAAQWRKAVLASMYLNQFATIYFGIENRLFKASLTPSLENALRKFMRHDDIFEVVQNGIFDPKFVALCRKCRLGDGRSHRNGSRTGTQTVFDWPP